MTGPVDPRLLRHARGARGGVVALVALGVVSAATTVTAAVTTGVLIGALVDRPGRLPRTELTVLAGVVVVRALLAWAQPTVAARCAGRVVDGLRERLLVAGTGRPALVAGGLDALRPWFTTYLPTLVLGVVVPPAVLVVLLVTDPPSALVVALTLPLVPVFGVLLGRATRARAERQWAAGERLAGHFLDVVAGLATLRLFGRARRQADEVSRLGAAHRQATMSVLRVAFTSTTALELLSTVSVGLVAVSAGLRLVDGTLGVTAALVAILVAPEAHRPLREVGARFHDTASATVVLDEVDAVLDGPGGDAPAGGPPSVSVRDLRVRVAGRRADVLSLRALDVTTGELVVLTGPSGSGKTTLIRVLSGLVRPTSGRVVVGGRPAVLPQHPTLPHARTVGEAIGGPDPRALLARLGLDLDPDLPLAEGGRSVSSGQRRRVALARTLRDAGADPAGAVVLLDEPTAHLDAVAERAVLTELRALAGAGAAVLVVAHRPAVAAVADRTLVLAPPTGTRAPLAPPTGTRAPLASAFPEGDGGPGRGGDAGRGDGARRGGEIGNERAASRHGVVAAVGLGTGATLAGVALTASAAWLIGRAAGHPPVLALSLAVVAVRAAAVARPALRHLERIVAHDSALARVVAWRRAVVATLAERVPGTATGRRGHLLARVTADVDTRLDGLVRGWLPLAVAVVTLPLVVALLGVASPAVAAVVAAGVGLAALAMPVVAVWGDRVGRDVDRGTDALLAAVVESESGRAELLPRGADHLLAVPRRRAAALERARRRAGTVTGAGAAIAQLGLGVAVLGVVPAVPGSTSPALLAVLVLTPLALAEPLLGLPDGVRAVVDGRRARARRRRLDETPLPVRASGRLPTPPGTDLVLHGVSAGWDPAGPPAVSDLDLEIPAGARVVITGASGAGKSTLAAVLARLLDPTTGRITLGGVDVTTLDADAVRRRVALVGEQDHVFATSVRDNLRVAAPDADDAALAAVLGRVSLDGWLAGLADGLDTEIDAERISGGERRRLALARALLADPAVLVLDEPTEGLDAETADAVLDDLLVAADPARTLVVLVHEASGEVARRVTDAGQQGGQRAHVVRLQPDQPEVDRGDRDGGGLAPLPSRVGDLDEGGATVGGMRATRDEAGVLEAVDDVRDGRRVQLQPLAHDAHRQ